MALLLYAHRLSQPSRAVEILLRELDLAYDWHEIDFANGQTHEADYAERINAFETVPAVHVSQQPTAGADAANGMATILKIGESEAALRYLCRIAGDKGHAWYPGDMDPARSAAIDQWLSWHHGNIRRHDMFHHIMNLHQTLPMLKREIQATLLAPLQRALVAGLTTLDAQLGTHDAPADRTPTLAGTRAPTLADLVIACELYQIVAVGYRFDRYPHVKRWLDGLAARSFFAAVSEEIDALGADIQQQNGCYLALNDAFG